MKYQGDIYVFDLDDTLVWSPHWYDEAVVDSNDIVVAPGRSKAIKAALAFINRAKEYNLPNQYRNMKLKKKFKKQDSGKNIYFELLDGSNSPVKETDLSGYISPSELKIANLKVKKSYSDFLSVATDYDYYEILDTVGEWGYNEEMIELYKKYHPNVVILTARSQVPGMTDKIHDIITMVAEKPKAIFCRPKEVINAGREKGQIISAIASIPEVNHVYFYDDNSNYIKNAQNMVDRYKLTEKVTINKVDPQLKPRSFDSSLSSKIINLTKKLSKEERPEVIRKINELLGGFGD